MTLSSLKLGSLKPGDLRGPFKSKPFCEITSQDSQCCHYPCISLWLLIQMLSCCLETEPHMDRKLRARPLLGHMGKSFVSATDMT